MSKKLIDAAGYIRMSTDKQEDSPERQRHEIEKLAAQHGCRVAHWYQDLGMTGTESAKRGGFQKLLKDADKRMFRVVLYHEPSRLSREHPLDFLAHVNAFRNAGVRLITSLRGEVKYDDIASLLMAMIDSHGSHDESVKIAVRVVSGKRVKLLRGERVAGHVFGYDREMIDESGQVIKRVHFTERFRKPPGWKVRLVPSHDGISAKAVKEAFRRVADGESVHRIAAEFRARGLRTVTGNLINFHSVRNMIANPIYCGTLVSGLKSNGKFCRLDGDGVITVRDAHPAIVSAQLFQDAQDELKRRGRRGWGRTTRRDAQFYTLSKVLRCATCGGPLYGGTGVNGSRRQQRYYVARDFLKARGQSHRCGCVRVQAEHVERAVFEALRSKVFVEGNANLVSEELAFALGVGTQEPNTDRHQLEALEAKIQRGEQNLAEEMSLENLRAIGKMVDTWREQARALRQSMTEADLKQRHTQAVIDQFNEFLKHREDFENMNEWKLRAAIRATVERVTIGFRFIGQGAARRRVWHGELFLSPAGWDGGPIPLDSRLLNPRENHWREVADWVVAQRRAVKIRDISEHFGRDPASMSIKLAKCVDAGLLEKVGRLGGWAAPASVKPR